MRTLYGQDHPYGQPYTGTGTEESIRTITSKDLRQFYEAYFRPNNATLIVVGDVSTDEILPILEKALKSWRNQDIPLVKITKVRKIEGNHIFLIDKPGAPQSVVVTGHLGLLRNSPDYYRAEVMNTILGGKFTSRLNMNLREDKGYTYFALSQFMYLREIGPFMALTQVDTKFTKETVIEMLKEYRGLAGSIPVSSEELDETKKYMTLSYPGGFETLSQIADRLGETVTYNLPKDYFHKHVPALERVSISDVTEAAKRYIHPDSMLFVIMGDVKKIEQGIRDLKLGEIHYLDLDGNPVKK
jgi:zinc protease